MKLVYCSCCEGELDLNNDNKVVEFSSPLVDNVMDGYIKDIAMELQKGYMKLLSNLK